MWTEEKRIKALGKLLPNLYNYIKGELRFEDDIKAIHFQRSSNSGDGEYGEGIPDMEKVTMGLVLVGTGGYNPADHSITLNIQERLPKDILRSFAHELVHHWQACRGELGDDDMYNLAPDYAQKNEKLRKLESEAYEVGNMLFRTWEDQLKSDEEKMQSVLAEQSMAKYFKAPVTGEPRKLTLRSVFEPAEDLRRRYMGGENLENTVHTSLDSVLRDILDPLMKELGYQYAMSIDNDTYVYSDTDKLDRTEITFFMYGAGGAPRHGNPYAEHGESRVVIQVDSPSKGESKTRDIRSERFDSLPDAIDAFVRKELKKRTTASEGE
jgi:hypothetical protein